LIQFGGNLPVKLTTPISLPHIQYYSNFLRALIAAYIPLPDYYIPETEIGWMSLRRDLLLEFAEGG